jgi:hypothetical protein
MAENNTVQIPESLEYPFGISTIPYASYLNIKKYEYQEGLKKVATNQNDALGSLERSGNNPVGLKNLVSGVSNTAAGLYGSIGNDIDVQAINQNERIGSDRPNNRTNPKITEISQGDEEIILPNGKTTTLNKLLADKSEKLEKREAGLQSSQLNVAMPDEYQYSYGADWNNKFKMGTLALAADSMAQFAMLTVAGGAAGGLLQAGLSRLGGQLGQGGSGNILSSIGANPADYAQKIAGGAAFATNPYGVNGEVNMKNIAGLAGLAPNENAIQMFQSMDMRKFDFTLAFAARDATESEEIQTIIEWFKRGMHPGSRNGRGSAVTLTFPDVFVLEPRFVPVDPSENGRRDPVIGDPIQHPMMPKTKLCALTSLSVNTTPMSKFQTVFDGSIPLVTVTLHFMETTALTRVDFEGARKRTGRGDAGGFNKSSLTDNQPEIVF